MSRFLLSPITRTLAANVFLSGAASAAMVPYRAIVGIEALGFSNSTFGIILVLNAVAATAAAVILGWLSDRIKDRRMLLLLCAVVGAAGLSVIWAVRTPLAFVIAFCLMVPFGNALFSQSFSYARVLFNRDHAENAELRISFLRSIFTLAWIVLPPIAGWVAAETSAYGAFGLAAAMQIGCILFVGMLFAHKGSLIGNSAKSADGKAELEKAQIPSAYKIGIFGVTLGAVAVQLNMTALPLFIVRDLNGSYGDVGINASIAAIIEVPAMIAWGYLSLRLRKETILSIAYTVFAVYFAGMAFATTVHHVMALQVLAAIAISALLSINISYLQDAIRGRVGLSTSLVDVTRVLSVMIASGIFAMIATDHYGVLMIAGGIISVAAVVAMSVAKARATAQG